MPPMDDPMGGADPMMGGMGDETDPMGGADMPPMGDDNSQNEDPMGDGANEGSSDQQELDDIFNNASLEDKNAILKYAKSQTEQNSNDDSGNEEPQMPMESKKYSDKLVNEIVNGIISDFDMNDREGKKGTKRDEKKISKRMLNRKGRNPFISDR